jgi:hypothetical protein
MPFGLSLGSTNVNNFWLEKVQHKLNYWASTKLSLARKKVIVNSILLSSFWYFVNVGEGPKKESLELIASSIITFGQDQIIIVGVKLHGTNVVGKIKMGVSLVDPIKIIKALLSKW